MYKLDYRADGVYFKLEADPTLLSESDKKIILETIRRKNITGLQIGLILQALQKSGLTEVKIANPQVEKLIDEELRVRISSDHMQVYAALLPADGGKLLTFDDLISILEKNAVYFGVNIDQVQKMLAKRQYEVEFLVAQGTPPENGKDAELEFLIELNRKPTPRIDNEGQIDYKFLDMIENVRIGQILVRLQPATKGISGKTVSGREVQPKSGKTIALPRGKNTDISENGLELLASIEGKAEYIDRKVQVYSLHEIKGNVDNSTGNINFVGNVIINGNVISGFEVRAGGFIEVRGVVEGANLIASGNIILKRGLQGMGKGMIVSGGSVIARFIESGSVSAKGDIIAEAIMHSTVKCGGKIKVAGKKGLLVGGKLQSGSDISAFTIGSPMATFTEIEVGIDPGIKLEYETFKKDKEKLNLEILKAKQILTLLEKMEMSAPLPLEKMLIKVKAQKTLDEISKSLDDVSIRITELEELIMSVADSKVSVSKTVYPSVVIAIGASSLRVKDTLERVTFKREHGEVRASNYQPIL
ncbi:MAG: FapA family protein [Patescibacteria group bacterium]|nr:FapA family protein [Patescibacteria group bacterium]